MTRRSALRTLAGGAVGIASAGYILGGTRATFAADAAASVFVLPDLGYAYDALEPFIDAKTMEIHHSKHHAGYVKNLNDAIAEESSLAGKSLEELMRGVNALPDAVKTKVRNNGGGHYNHDLFWKSLKPGGSKPTGAFAEAVDKKFKNLEGLTDKMREAGGGQFGSGWSWLSLDDGELMVESTPNQDNPLMEGRQALLGIDVWEHAYYLKYQNRRGDYLQEILNVIDWEFVSTRYGALV